MPRLSKIGAAALAAFGWTGLSSVTASYLQVAGGGGGGSGDLGSVGGAGGGAGGYLTGTTTLNTTQSYTVVVGAGGAGGVYSGTGVNGVQGSNSQFDVLTASVGGGYGAYGTAGVNGGNGGSGGGGCFGGTGGTATSGQGSAGGTGSTSLDCRGSGGGGGASAVGANGSSAGGGNGGNGTASSITGTSVTYAGGGGGGALYRGGGFTVPTVATGGTGGGGNSGTGTGGNGNPGTANLGGGGGGPVSIGAGTFDRGGNGGSGVVIISYVGAQQFGGGVVTSSGGNTIHTFNTSGTLSPLSSLTASYLIVAGGGGGSFGGAGAGGLLSGSGLTIDTNSIYAVTVGAGGAGQDALNVTGTNGSNSAFSMVSTAAVGGGGGGKAIAPLDGASGGSGGGGGNNGLGGAGTSGQGNAGGNGYSDNASYGLGGGGGGASAVGQSLNAGSSAGGNGGAGSASSISGSSVTYAGGGGGGGHTAGSRAGGTGGAGGGGNGTMTGNASSGTNGLGGGGGGAGSASGNGGAGGSGVVIISYPGTTQQMAGGTVTVAGGNVIHTFTSSGYLTPLTLVGNSLRFRASASAFLNRTFPTAGNTQKFTQSIWTKRGVLGAAQWFGVTVSGNASYGMYFDTNDSLYSFIYYTGSVWQGQLYTTQLFRDPAAWYHIVLAVDTTQAVASNRVKVYVNGVQVTSFSTENYPNQNQTLNFNSAAAHFVNQLSSGSYYDGYIAELNWIDGQQLTPNSFGTFNGLGVWQPIRYGGSYGTNGFYLPFTNTTSTTTLGYDFSPQGNNWTTNNISLTAGSTYDSMTDVPTLTSATTANYAVLNPLDGNNATLSGGNLNFVTLATGSANTLSSIYVATGKWYWEVVATNNGGDAYYGIRNGPAGYYVAYYAGNGNKDINGSSSAYGATYGNNDIIGVALDMDAGTITFYKNNASQGAITIGNLGPFAPWIADGASFISVTGSINFGQRPFSYTPPTGFNRLNTFNLPTPTIGATASTIANEYFDATLYTGNSTTNNIVNAGGMQPDLVWIKSRSNAQNNNLFDSIRGAGYVLFSNATNAETNNTANFTSFNSNGFSLASNGGDTNLSGYTYVGWQWRASNTTPVSNTAGSITSTVSASTTAGFSIVTYTGTGANATVGHGLGATPSMVIVKCRSTAGESWHTYHVGLSSLANTVYLNGNAAQGSFPTCFNSMSTLNSTVFSLGTDGASNGSGRTYVSYVFSQVAGYSAFGSYTGNGSSDGPFVFTGFRPRFLLIKNSSTTVDWVIEDTSRDPYNVAGVEIFPNLSNAESSGNADLDILSNGFKIRRNSTFANGSGNTIIYMAFAESPFKYSLGR